MPGGHFVLWFCSLSPSTTGLLVQWAGPGVQQDFPFEWTKGGLLLQEQLPCHLVGLTYEEACLGLCGSNFEFLI